MHFDLAQCTASQAWRGAAASGTQVKAVSERSRLRSERKWGALPEPQIRRTVTPALVVRDASNATHGASSGSMAEAASTAAAARTGAKRCAAAARCCSLAACGATAKLAVATHCMLPNRHDALTDWRRRAHPHVRCV